MVGLQPAKVYKKGERLNPKFARLSKMNSWILDPPCPEFSSFETQMAALLGIIESKMPVFKRLAISSALEFSCAIFINNHEESTPWVHLDGRYNSVVAQVPIEFDVDLYC